jgi:hypothetical protein
MTDSESKPRKHLNQAQKRARQAADLNWFVQSYGRKAQKSKEPNDRWYDRDLERRIKCMKPADLDQLLRDDED